MWYKEKQRDLAVLGRWGSNAENLVPKHLDRELGTSEEMQGLLPLVYTTVSQRCPKSKCNIKMAEIPYSCAPPIPLNQFFKGLSGDPATNQ